MAGDWIPMRMDLDEDPTVVGVASACKVPELLVIGWLWKLWSVSSRQTASGWLPHYTPQKVDGLVSHNGFASALESAGWLHRRPGGIEIPNFDTWLSQSAKKRLKEARNKWLSRREKQVGCPEDVRFLTDKNGTLVLSCDSPDPPNEGGSGGEKTNGISPSVELAQFWCFHLKRRRRRGPADDPVDIEPQFAELLRLGAFFDALKDEIMRADRDRSEHFWEFKKRVITSRAVRSDSRIGTSKEKIGLIEARTIRASEDSP